jgi:hypothetical protein
VKFQSPVRWLQRAAWTVLLGLTATANSAQAEEPVEPAQLKLPAEAPPEAPATLPVAPPAPCPPPAPPAGPKWQTPLPRPGYFAVPPADCGYYSVIDQIRGNQLQAPPKYPYPRISPIFISNADVNWTYLKNPANTEHDYADGLKWIPIGENATITTGGELRYRFMNEVNSNGRVIGQQDAHSLYRARLYSDLWVNDWFRVFGEFLYGDVTSRSIPPLATDIDRGDILNLFADVRLFQFGEKDNPVYFRAGRQELLYGSQRLISTLDWVNTRRTFDGFKVFTRTEKWDFDVFGVSPVVPPRGTQFDTYDHNQFFSGAWFTYRNAPGQNIDLYYLNLDNTNLKAAIGNGGVPGNYNVSTFGARYAGVAGNWLFDLEGMLQTGHYSNQSIVAKAFNADVGYNFKDVMWNPQLWVGYEYASGDPDPQNSGTRRTFNQLFPFGHYYFGFADIVGRQNINDFFLSGWIWPENWWSINTQFHVFRLDSNKDALYGPGGNALRQDKTGRAGNNVGNELDLMTNFHLTKHSDVLVGYSYLWAGEFLKNTAANPAQAANPSLFYTQYSYRW